MYTNEASKALTDLLGGMTAHDGLALLVGGGGLVAILTQAPTAKEREASLENADVNFAPDLVGHGAARSAGG
jgi:hypothetical protein